MLRSILACILALAALPLLAKDFAWFPAGGDRMSFSDPGNWYDLASDANPHNPSGPPGPGDTVSIGSGASITATGGAVKKLSGGSLATFNVSGTFTADVSEANFTLTGSGTLNATSLTISPTLIDGGHLFATNYTARGIAVTNNGSVEINGNLIAHILDTVNLFVDQGATLTIHGYADGVSGAISGGAHATMTSLFNTFSDKPTLDVGGANTELHVTGFADITDGSLDVNTGAQVSIDGPLNLDGRRVGKQSFGSTSKWMGGGTKVTIGGELDVSLLAGPTIVEVSGKASVSAHNNVTVGAFRDSDGKITFSDEDTFLGTSGYVTVGGAGKGTITASEKAVLGLSDALLTVGSEERSHGTLQIDSEAGLVGWTAAAIVGRDAGSEGSVMLNRGSFQTDGIISGTLASLVIGDAGKGTFSARAASKLSLTSVGGGGDVVVGNQSSGNGLLLIGDSGTTADFRAVVSGVNGTGAIDVSSSASVTSNTVEIGADWGRGTIGISDGATWNNATDTSVSRFLGGVASLIVKTGGQYRTRRGLGIGEHGVVKIDGTGSIAVGEGFFGPAGTLRVGNLGILSGAGVIEGNVLVGDNGHIEPGFDIGELFILGNYTQEVGGIFDVEVGGTGAKTDLLKITGSATLSGTLNVTLVNGFNPKKGQKFKVMTCAQRTGEFDTVNGATVEYTADGFVVDPIVPPSTLTVTVSPDNPTLGGFVSPGFLGDSDRVAGFTYTVKATPAKGFVFAGWTGDLTSSNPNLTFVMQPNMALQANFVTDVFVPQVLGAYEGLATRTGTDGLEAGVLKVMVNKLGSFSAKFLLGGKPYGFGGIFTGQGVYRRHLVISGRTFDIDLTLDLTGHDTASGTIGIDGASYAVTSNRATFTKAATTNRAGSYTLLFPPNADNTDHFAPRPQGHGWATVTISSAGAVKIVGKLADGVTLSGGGALAKDGTFGLGASLYKGLGVFAGKLTFAAPPRDPDPIVSDVTGTMTWTKPAEKKNPIFPRPFTTALETLGSFYDPPAPDTRVLTGLNASGDARLKFRGGDLPAEVIKDIVISTKNVATYPAPASAADQLKLTFAAKTGAFAGSFLHPGTSKTKAFTGVVLRKQTRGAGVFLDATDSGQVELAAP